MGFVVIVLGVGTFAATRSAFLDIDRVEVILSGGRALTEAQVIAAAGASIGDPMVSLDLDDVAKRVQGLAYTKEAVVSREWPGLVRIWTTVRSPIANASEIGGRVALLDEDGVILEHLNRVDPALPSLQVDWIGEVGSRVPNIDPLLRAVTAVTPDLAPWILILSPVGDGVRAGLVGGAEVDLGLREDYGEAMRSLATILSRVELRCLRSIDVTIPQNPVVVRSPVDC